MSAPDSLSPLVTHHHTDDGERSFLAIEWGGRRLQVHRSPAGRSIRVWLDGNELKAQTNAQSAENERLRSLVRRLLSVEVPTDKVRNLEALKAEDATLIAEVLNG